MKNSSNSATNAVQERVGTASFPPIPPWSLNMAGAGRFVLNNFVSSLGMTGTAVNHKFGCEGFCGNPTPNTFTLVDFEKLYQAIATTLLTPANRVVLKDLMLNESGSFLDDIIDQEAADTGKNAWKERLPRPLLPDLQGRLLDVFGQDVPDARGAHPGAHVQRRPQAALHLRRLRPRHGVRVLPGRHGRQRVQGAPAPAHPRRPPDLGLRLRGRRGRRRRGGHARAPAVGLAGGLPDLPGGGRAARRRRSRSPTSRATTRRRSPTSARPWTTWRTPAGSRPGSSPRG